MKRIRSWRRFELLEQKRLKAADLAACPDAHGPAFVEAAEASPMCGVTEVRGYLELPSSLFASASAEVSEDESDDDQDDESESESDDSDENETDETESDNSDEENTDEDESDDNDDESDDDESDEDDSDEGDDDSSDENDTDESDSDEDDSEVDETDDEEEDDDEGDDDPSDENDTDEDDSAEEDDDDESDDQEMSAPITLSAESGVDDRPAVPAQRVSANAALSPVSAESAGFVPGPTASTVGHSSAKTAPVASSSSATAADPNLLDAVYVASEGPRDAGDATTLVACDATEQNEATDAVFESIVSNPLTWVV